VILLRARYKYNHDGGIIFKLILKKWYLRCSPD